MSAAALAPMAIKALTGAVVSKVVGKVTDNDKLGMVAGIVAGAALPVGGAGSDFGLFDDAADVVSTGTSAGPESMFLGQLAGTEIPNQATTQVAGGMLSRAGEFIQNNPYPSMMAGQTIAGAAEGYEARKAMEAQRKLAREQALLDRQHEIGLVKRGEDERSRNWERSRLPAGYGPRSSRPTAQRPMSGPEQYFQKYNAMYSKGVR